MAELFSIALYTLLLAYMGVGNLRIWVKRRLVAVPNERSSHTRPTPSGGGVAIAGAGLLGIYLFALLQQQWTTALWCYGAGAALIALVSWYDDRYTVANRIRFGIHSIGALLLVGGSGFVNRVEIPLLGNLPLGWLGLALCLLWLVGMTNAYNFMDSIDGLAGSQAVLAGGSWALLGYWLDQQLLMALGLFLAAGSLGFLGHNWPPARIFMGDGGRSPYCGGSRI